MTKLFLSYSSRCATTRSFVHRPRSIDNASAIAGEGPLQVVRFYGSCPAVKKVADFLGNFGAVTGVGNIEADSDACYSAYP